MANPPLSFLGLYSGGGQSPTLIPNFSLSAGSNGRGLVQQSPSDYLEANPRANASVTATIGGTITATDVVSLVLTNGVLGNSRLGLTSDSVTVSYTVQAADTIDTIAEGLANAINSDATLRYYAYATVSGAVVTIEWPGPVGNFTGITDSVSGSATETVTLSASTLAGGSGPVLVWENFNWASSNDVKSYFMNNFYDVSGQLSRLVSFAAPIR